MSKYFRYLYIVLFLVAPLSFVDAQESMLTESQKNSVDIIWQGNTYTPPFYKGRSLWPFQGEIILSAITSSLNSKNLTYKWVRNGTVQGNLSGVGKNSYIFSDAGLFLPQRIRVDVLNDDELIGRASVSVRPSPPIVLAYENSPLLGYVFEKEASNLFKLNKEEISFSAFPYYFSTPFKDGGSVTYLWRINNSSSNQVGSKVTFRAPKSEGKSLVSVDIKNLQKVTQSAKKDFLVQFDNENQF
jgi:hypothetical protein